ncbi:VOC family protein [Microvirga terricola]|uniref:VOC family protein n=1 Tax=Microvirga terricola TaxID=2719797 RepID=A0ABX0VAP3_9HYPH|nr:VOC family protein [Microvirga terricola]NIX76922.1 VOC family protein [Microvirga terricola]
MNPVVWFEIPVNDLDKAKAFYEHILGLTLSPMDMGEAKMVFFPMSDQQQPGATGALMKSDGYAPSHNGTVIYFEVPDIEGTLKKVAEKGGKTLVPKMSIGQYGFIAHFEDTEGNRVALHSM